MKQPDEVLGVKIVGGLHEASTPWAGASLLVELFRRCGLEALLGYRLPAPETARQWLDRFHDEALMTGQPLPGSFILSNVSLSSLDISIFLAIPAMLLYIACR